MKTKPCPFCGSSNVTPIGNDDFNEWFECVNCGSCGPCEYKPSKWNTRPREEELIQALEELNKQVTMSIISSAWNPDKWDALTSANYQAEKLLERIKAE